MSTCDVNTLIILISIMIRLGIHNLTEHIFKNSRESRLFSALALHANLSPTYIYVLYVLP